MRRLTKNLSLVALAAVAAITLSACNTVSGMGQDIEAAGKGIDNTADETKRKM